MPKISEVQKYYRATFNDEQGRLVLGDLAKFCYATQTTYAAGKNHEVLEGRRQVFLRIMDMLKIDIEEVYNIEKESDYD
jgi:hypothetical protein